MDGARLQTDIRRQAVHAAYHLAEAVQTPDAEGARRDLGTALVESRRCSWPEVERVVLYAMAVDAVVNEPEQAAAACAELLLACDRDGDAALRAAGLGMRAELAVRTNDYSEALYDLTRATLLLDEPGDPLARASGLISLAETYGLLNLWELGDELYARAEALMPDCDDPLLEPVTLLNRAFTRFWWAAGLLEVGGSPDEAGLATGESDGEELAALPMPESWRQMLVVSVLARRVLLGESGAEVVTRLEVASEHVTGLDVRLQVQLALAHAHLRASRLEEARQGLRHVEAAYAESMSPLQRVLFAWTAALAENLPPGSATAEYAAHVAQQRWNDRVTRLVSFRSRIEGERMRAQHDDLVRQTLEDPLTGLGNRRAFDVRLAELAMTLDPEADVALVILDVDYFKAINDLHGHVVGDLVLERIARVLASALRPGDVAVRLGGDEFCAVLVGAPRAIVVERSERIRRLLAEVEWGLVAPSLKVGVSVGVATGRGPDELGELYRRADVALYSAKQEGRGRLRLAI